MKAPSILTLTALLLSCFVGPAALAQSSTCSQAQVSNTAILKAALDFDLEQDASNQLLSGSVERLAQDKAFAQLSFQDGYQVRLTSEIGCDGSISMTRKPDNFRCVSYVDCMPSDTVERVNFCTKAYFSWAKKNCEKQPMVVH